MSQSRKKTPQIDPRMLTRRRLNALFNRHTGAHEIGPQPARPRRGRLTTIPVLNGSLHDYRRAG